MDASLVVLLVEDSPSDRRLTTEVLDETGLSMRVCCVETGEEALEFLRGAGAYEDAPRPDLVLLDLGLPGLSGKEVLARTKADGATANIPVVALTSNDDDRVLVEALGLGAHEFVTKPLDRDQIMEVIQYVTQFA
jgi:chemotaxis family two-component system response regulator Rcp1